MDFERLAVEHMTCPTCKAEPPYWCETTRGKHIGMLASRIHQPRMQVLYDVYFEGYREGIKDAEYRAQIMAQRRAS